MLRLSLLACALALVVAFTAPPAEAAKSPCSGTRFTPGHGMKEWKLGPRPIVRTRGVPAAPMARAGAIVVLSGITRIGGRRRHGFAAIDLRTGRPTAFDPPVPARRYLTAMTASPTAMYVAHESYDEAPVGEKEIQAYDLRTGALLPAFAPPDFRVGLLGQMVYAGGRVVIGGAPPVGAGITLGAYDAGTGARVWQAAIDWPVRSLAVSGSRVFAEVPPEIDGPHIATAFNAADGSSVPGWGASLPGRSYRAPLEGADTDRVFGLSGVRPRDVRPYVLSTRDGRPVSFPRLPGNASALRPGAGGTLLGRIRVRSHSGPAAYPDAMFERSGRLIGVVPGFCRVLTMRDARHALVTTTAEDRRARIFELVRPRR